MFDLITERTERPFREPALLPRILSMTLHIAVVTFVIAIPLLTVTGTLPEAPAIMAFVADAAAPPPPPPPPPPPAPRAASKAVTPQPTPSANAFAAPVEAPADIRPEPVTSNAGASTGVVGGVAGGVEGGVVGGIVGGIVGGVVAPPPPPPPPVERAPVRIGGQIKTPALLHRVEPEYPDIAAAARLTGLVILEALVDNTGCVESVKVLRSGHPLLDREAVAALKQWRYTPLVLNGTPTPFVLTVTFNFSVSR
jgi:periplasmic protein TonB